MNSGPEAAYYQINQINSATSTQQWVLSYFVKGAIEAVDGLVLMPDWYQVSRFPPSLSHPLFLK